MDRKIGMRAGTGMMAEIDRTLVKGMTAERGMKGWTDMDREAAGQRGMMAGIDRTIVKGITAEKGMKGWTNMDRKRGRAAKRGMKAEIDMDTEKVMTAE